MREESASITGTLHINSVLEKSKICMQWVHLCPGLTQVLFNQYFMFDEAKYSLGEVRLELMQSAVFAAAINLTD